MYSFLLNFHSGFRYIVLVLVILAIILALVGLFGKKPYTSFNRKINLFAMISMHTQLLIGLILYFVSPAVNLENIGAAMKNASQRYWTIEHLVLMLFAVVLVTVGHSRSKRINSGDVYRHRAVAMFYGLAILVVIVAIYQSGRPLIGS